MSTVTDDQVTRFARLFTGFPDRFGRFEIYPDQTSVKLEGEATTAKGSPSVTDWRAHLEGTAGIGIIPLLPDDTIRFAAIDVDTYDGPPGWHQRIARRIRHLPVACTESKSGGLHIWLHSAEGLPARLAVEFLKKIRFTLGLPDAKEIFPKQVSRQSDQDVGNWINSPHFGDTRRVIWFGEENGKLAIGPRDLDSFLTLAESNAALCTESEIRRYLRELRDTHRATGASDPDLPELQDGPPCLQCRLYGDPEARARYRKLRKDGTLTNEEASELRKLTAPNCPTGIRNTVMFNAGVYFNRKNGGDINRVESDLREVNNARRIDLDSREISTIARSVGRKEYSYQCNDPALADYCDRELCSRRKYGITALKPRLESIAPDNIRKLMSTPPLYLFDVNGHGLSFSPDELYRQATTASRITAVTNLAYPMVKDSTYKGWLNSWLSLATPVEAPSGADFRTTLREVLIQFLDEAHERTGNDAKFFMGRVLHDKGTDNQEAWFAIRHFAKFIKRDGMRPAPRELTEALKSLGCTSGTSRIANRGARYWSARPDDLKH